MRNYIQPGKTVTVPAPAPVQPGAPVQVGGLIGIAAGAAASGEAVDLQLEGVFDLAKVAADAVTVGAPVFWDATAALATIDDDEGANARLGHATEAAASGAASVKVRLQQV